MFPFIPQKELFSNSFKTVIKYINDFGNQFFVYNLHTIAKRDKMLFYFFFVLIPVDIAEKT